jgi:hypothetical protein
MALAWMVQAGGKSSPELARAPVAGGEIIAGLLFSALAVTALANNLVTLMIGVGLVDFLAILSAMLQNRNTGRALRDALFYGGSSILFLIAIALYGASSNSLYFPLAHISERLMPLITAALALRFCLVPLRAAADVQREIRWTTQASTLAGFVILLRLPQFEAPQMRAWFFVLALLTAVTTLALAVLSNRRSAVQGYVAAGALGVALTSAATWQSGIIAAAAIAWLLGTTLVNASAPLSSPVLRPVLKVTRWLGAACLVAVPLTVGFVGRAGVITAWDGRGVGGVALILGLTLAQVLLTLCSLRLVTWRDAASDEEISPMLSYASIIILTVLGLQVLIYGINPSLAGAPGLGQLFGRNGLAGWLLWLMATAVGGLAWWFESRWREQLTAIPNTVVNALSLNWLQDIVAGALRRLANPLASVFIFFESDGALLWAVVVILIVILVSRPGGP